MNDNGIRIAFDYKKPDEAVLITYKIWGWICVLRR